MRRLTGFILLIGLAVAGQDAAADGLRRQGKAQNLLAETDSIAREVGSIRGLAIKRPIARAVKDRAAIRAAVLAELARDSSDAEIAVEARVFKRLGLLPRSVDLKTLFVDLMTEQIAGYYDPYTRELAIAQDAIASADDGRMVMAHEICHALQDQHFDLRSFLHGAGDHNSDAATARLALVEGDGMALMIEYMFARMGLDPPWGDPAATRQLKSAFDSSRIEISPELAGAPLAVRVGVVFPYAAGLDFVVRYRTYHPWRRISAMYARPPLSTEHILHPRRYSRYELPDEVVAAPLKSLAGYRTIYEDVTGELGFMTLLRQHGVGNPAAGQAADGWGGDRLVAYAPADDDGSVDSLVVVSYSVWDSEIDAQEFFAVIKPAVAGLAVGGKLVASQDDLIIHGDKHGRAAAAARYGDAVIVVIGAAAEHIRSVLAELRRAWIVKRK
jgi:hypothetical protein